MISLDVLLEAGGRRLLFVGCWTLNSINTRCLLVFALLSYSVMKAEIRILADVSSTGVACCLVLSRSVLRRCCVSF